MLRFYYSFYNQAAKALCKGWYEVWSGITGEGRDWINWRDPEGRGWGWCRWETEPSQPTGAQDTDTQLGSQVRELSSAGRQILCAVRSVEVESGRDPKLRVVSGLQVKVLEDFVYHRGWVPANHPTSTIYSPQDSGKALFLSKLFSHIKFRGE